MPAKTPDSPVALEQHSAPATTQVGEAISAAFAQAESAQQMLRGVLADFDRLQHHAEQAEVDLAKRRQQFEDETQKQLRTHVELEQRTAQLDEREKAFLHQQAGFENQQLELAAQQKQLETDRAAAAQQLEEAQRTRTSLDEQQAALAAARSELENQQAQLQAAQAELAPQREALAALQAELEQQQSALAARVAVFEQRERELIEADKALAKRHDAVARFQHLFSEMAASLGMSGAGLPELHGALGLKPSGAAAEGAPTAGPGEQPATPTQETTAAHDEPGPAAAGAPAGDAPASAAQPPATQPGVGPAAERTATGALPRGVFPDGRVDESLLDADELQRLKVLRRLTGGSRTDAQLLERIRQERETQSGGAPPAKKSGKRGWF